MDVRVFNPYAASNQHQQQSAVYRKHENEKKRMYEQQIREVEHGSFTSLVMLSTGGLGNSATAFYKRLASMLALKVAQYPGFLWLTNLEIHADRLFAFLIC